MSTLQWLGLLFLAVAAAILLRRRWAAYRDRAMNRHMAGLAQQARMIAQEKNDLRLDFSPESIKALDQLLAALHHRHGANPIPDAELGDAVNLWGAYLGETIRRHKPGAWRCDSAVGGKGSLPMVHAAGEEAFPLAWTYRRIVNGEEDNLWRKFQALYLRG